MAKEPQQIADEDLDVLRKQAKDSDAALAAERARREAAEKEAGEARAKAEEEINNRVAADEAAVTNAIAAQEATISGLEQELQEAGEKGDFKAMAAINRKIASAQYSIEGYAASKRQIESWKRQQLAAAEERRKNPQRDNRQPTREEVLSRYTPRTRSWLEKHTDILDDQVKTNRATAAHFNAIAEGLTADTDEYFEYLEKSVYGGGQQGQKGGSAMSEASEVVEDVQVEEPDEKDPGAVAVAPSRTTPRPGRRGDERPGTVRLSQAEIEIAERSNTHLATRAERIKAFAQAKAELQKEGRL